MFKIFCLMILLHIIDDFVLQPICLSKLKCKEVWEDANKRYNNMYKNDYVMALLIHALSWSIMIHLPLMFLMNVDDAALAISIIINMFVHLIVDDLKANHRKINLICDQSIHFVQIIWTLITISLI